LAGQIQRQWLDSLFAISSTALALLALFELNDVPANENDLAEALR
jgi:hypothetical protein